RYARTVPSTWIKTLRRLVYLLTSVPAVYTRLHGIVGWLSGWRALEAKLLEEDETVLHMPPDYLTALSGLEARVGVANLARLDRAPRNYVDSAGYYFRHIPKRSGVRLPPEMPGATYSHFVLRVRNRDEWVLHGLRAGIQLGTLYEYSMPELPDYGSSSPDAFPEAGKLARHTLHLPVWGGARLASEVVGRLFL
ncbi:MAG: DegT/DnrJ/EryC1/StrS family aminotransferase, partial [Deltaproteobacteria bacterium]|nr:DegT/DnrJ/EryC1/StrS family aminotransferase [Deltaproteobacteria bacterium]